jgi:hypothetical protein
MAVCARLKYYQSDECPGSWIAWGKREEVVPPHTVPRQALLRSTINCTPKSLGIGAPRRAGSGYRHVRICVSPRRKRNMLLPLTCGSNFAPPPSPLSSSRSASYN